MDWEVCSTDLKLWQRWLTLWICVKPLKLSRVELVKCNHHCLRFVGRGELNWQLESVHDFRRNGWYLQAACTGSSVNDTSYWNIRADQSLQNMLKLGTLLHNSRCRKYVGWCRLCRKNQSSGPIVDDLGSRHPCQRHWPEYLATSVWWPAKRREAGLRAKWPGGVGYGWIVGCNLQGKLTSQTKWLSQDRIYEMDWNGCMMMYDDLLGVELVTNIPVRSSLSRSSSLSHGCWTCPFVSSSLPGFLLVSSLVFSLPLQCHCPAFFTSTAPIWGLLSFLEQSCREDHGVFQLRASFDHPSSEDFVQVRVACPGTAPAKAAANSSETQPLSRWG